MTGPDRSPTGTRRGFSLMEIQAAFIVLGFSVAALVPFAVAQLKLVAALEKRLPPNATYVVMSRDHGLVSLLANGGGKPTQLIQAPPGGAPSSTTSSTSSSPTPNYLSVDPPQPLGTGPLDMTVTVQVKKVP